MAATAAQIRRWKAIRKAVATREAANDNAAPVRSSYVNTTLTPAMVAACAAAAGLC